VPHGVGGCHHVSLLTCRAGLAQAYHTASVLFEVLCALDRKAKPEEKVAPEDLVSGQNLQEKAAEIIPFNILPLDAAGASLAIMQLPEVRNAASHSLHSEGAKCPFPSDTICVSHSIEAYDVLLGC
jgi:callose synthase